MPLLLERDAELAALRERRRGGALVLVMGEAGAGKTSLVREFAAGAGARVLWGACEALSTPRPLGPFLDLELPGLDEDAGARDVLAAVGRLGGVVVLEDPCTGRTRRRSTSCAGSARGPRGCARW